MKAKMILLIKCLSIVVAVFLLISQVGDLLAHEARVYPIDSKVRKQIDVAFVGSSHIYCDIIPQKIFDDTGITSWDYAPAQPGMKNTYWAVREVYEETHPQLMVVELLMMCAGTSNKNNTATNLVQEMSMFTPIHYMAAYDMADEETDWQLLFRFTRNHTNYSNMSKHYFDAYSGRDVKYMQMGYQRRGANSIPNSEDEYHYSILNAYNSDYELDETNYQYFRKIIRFADDKRVPILFLLSPDVEHSRKEGFQAIDREVLNCGYTILDFNSNEGKALINFNITEDMCDIGHLSDAGALKLTDYMGKYLASNYNLTDHRSDSDYSYWSRNSYSYISTMNAPKLASCKDIEQYMQYLQTLNDWYSIFVMLDDGWQDCLSEQAITTLQSIVDIDIGKGRQYLIKHDGQAISDSAEVNTNIDGSNVYIHYDEDGKAHMCELNGSESVKSQNKVTIAVYDRTGNKILDRVTLNEADRELKHW